MWFSKSLSTLSSDLISWLFWPRDHVLKKRDEMDRGMMMFIVLTTSVVGAFLLIAFGIL
jgi:hypothetical protein